MNSSPTCMRAVHVEIGRELLECFRMSMLGSSIQNRLNTIGSWIVETPWSVVSGHSFQVHCPRHTCRDVVERFLPLFLLVSFTTMGEVHARRRLFSTLLCLNSQIRIGPILSSDDRMPVGRIGKWVYRAGVTSLWTAKKVKVPRVFHFRST